MTAAPPTRSRDAGQRLATFADEILVVCPRCAGCARVTAAGGRARAGAPARVRCGACGFARETDAPLGAWRGPWRIRVDIKRCGACTRAGQVLLRRAAGPGAGALRVACPWCGHAVTRDAHWSAEAPRFHDPHFGLALYLSERCGAHTLWAYNAQHLALLEDFVAARLREKRRPHIGQTLLTRLPRWLQDGGARREVLRAAARLRKKLV